MRSFGMVLASGAVLYVAMSACAAMEQTAGSATDGGGMETLVDGFVAEVMSPTKDAKADPAAPEVATEQCDKVLKAGGVDRNVAVHSYPGRSVNELASVRVVLEIGGLLDGYTHVMNLNPVYVSAGSVAVTCPPNTTSVTFIR